MQAGRSGGSAGGGALAGVLSIDDVLEKAGNAGGVSYREAVMASQAIGGRPVAAREL